MDFQGLPSPFNEMYYNVADSRSFASFRSLAYPPQCFISCEGTSLDFVPPAGNAMYASTKYDNLHHSSLNKDDAEHMAKLKLLQTDLGRVKAHHDANPDVLLVLMTDHGGSYPGDGADGSHGPHAVGSGN